MIGKRFCVLTCSPPGSQSAAMTTPLCPESALRGVLSTENSSLSSVSVPRKDKRFQKRCRYRKARKSFNKMFHYIPTSWIAQGTVSDFEIFFLIPFSCVKRGVMYTLKKLVEMLWLN